MNTIDIKAYAKINIALDVMDKREDGYHEVRMIMNQVGIYDTVTMSLLDTNEIVISSGSNDIPCDETNLAYKAAKSFMIEAANKGLDAKGVRIHIDKNIPVSAGLAGGSTDAAAVLNGLNELYGSPLSIDELLHIGASIGSDIPYCIVGGCAYAYGRGEKLMPLNSIDKSYILLVKPNFGVSTAAAYAEIDKSNNNVHPDVSSIRNILEKRSASISEIVPYMENTFEPVVCDIYPLIGDIINDIDKQGALKTIMSGSGPSIYAIYESRDGALNAAESIEKLYPDVNIYVTELM